MGLSERSRHLVDQGDLDELTMRVNGLVAAGDWDEMAELRTACRLAVQRGKQLWPVASHIEYRLCLEGPAPAAAAMVEEAVGRFSLGPLPEVAASSHSWDEMAPHLHITPQAAMFAHERALRGEDLSGDRLACGLPEVLDIPLRLMPWEPSYRLAQYHPDHLDAPAPTLPEPASATQCPGPTPAPGRDEACRALEELVTTWTEESNGRAEAVTVAGPAAHAIAALGAPGPRMVPVRFEEALSLMAWSAASGGAHGRRRGGAAGRYSAWLAVAALCGLDDWPLPAAKLGVAAGALSWWRWDAGEPGTGWACRLAAETDGGGRSWALAATDAA